MPPFLAILPKITSMIQRIQSLYFVLSFISAGVVSFLVPIFQTETKATYLSQYPTFIALFLAVALLSILALVGYKKRQRQLVLGRLGIIISFVHLGLMIYFWYANFEANPATFGLGVFLPLIQVILLSLANRGVLSDEKMIRAADRLR